MSHMFDLPGPCDQNNIQLNLYADTSKYHRLAYLSPTSVQANVANKLVYNGENRLWFLYCLDAHLPVLKGEMDQPHFKSISGEIITITYSVGLCH